MLISTASLGVQREQVISNFGSIKTNLDSWRANPDSTRVIGVSFGPNSLPHICGLGWYVGRIHDTNNSVAPPMKSSAAQNHCLDLVYIWTRFHWGSSYAHRALNMLCQIKTNLKFFLKSCQNHLWRCAKKWRSYLGHTSFLHVNSYCENLDLQPTAVNVTYIEMLGIFSSHTAT